ncbi:MAG: RagB/SusD family nutrient uptake outer membrane protein [Gemmatimonadetes bacterium]|nr:MAG: RagB/SusD family nutrient uptake outer membrane protein [Gemmatimonadota bacterium]
MSIVSKISRLGLAVVVALAAGACDIFDVDNPGQIRDEDLNTRTGVDPLVVGMSGDFSEEYDGIAFLVARATDEMVGSGSYSTTGEFRTGVIRREFTDGVWEGVSRARWVAENGLERIREILGDEFDTDERVARAYLFAGLANRVIAENFCEMTIDGGPFVARAEVAQRGDGHLVNAIAQAQRVGRSDIETAAIGGRAQLAVVRNDWAAAASFAAQVPTDFEFDAIYSSNSGREENEMYNETWGRPEMSAFMTLADVAGDVRTPWTDCRLPGAGCPGGDVGADGSTPHLRQDKYPESGADIPAVKGTEMRLIEAEAALRSGDLGTFNDKINEVRDFYGLPNITATSLGSGVTGDINSMTAWDVLDRERHLTLWLEGRRMFDLRRWGHPFLNGGGIVYEGVAQRMDCIPLSESECSSNTNISCDDPAPVGPNG